MNLKIKIFDILTNILKIDNCLYLKNNLLIRKEMKNLFNTIVWSQNIL